MTTLRQIAANRRNSQKSTGPRTEGGKQRSRRNALRHGLCAETVVELLEDVEDYKAFELAICSEYDAQSAVERELVLRLASLLWRIRRATAIETELLRVQAEVSHDRTCTLEPPGDQVPERHMNHSLLETLPIRRSWANALDNDESCEDHTLGADQSEPNPESFRTCVRELARCFKAVTELDNGIFDRLGRYEAALWRQILQTLFALQSARRRFGPSLRNGWCGTE